MLRCPICGKHPTITKLIDYEQFCNIRTKQDETPVESISATELKRRFDANEPVQVIDLREPHERAYFKFPNAKVIPLGQVVRRMDELDPAIDAVFVCKIGQRSILAIRNLRDAGYTGKAMNLQDGVQGWINEVDPSALLSSRDAGLLEPPERPQGSPASSSVTPDPAESRGAPPGKRRLYPKR